LYNDKAIQTFTACAVSDKKCVPQKIDRDVFKVPSPDTLDKGFDLNMFQGRWYITAGLNPLFDTFDCQEHYFGVPEPGKLYGKINWRIGKPDGDFIERSTIQTFKQQDNPAVLFNGGNEYLHYEDTWYILDSKPDEYAVIYYIGNNDAWKGYGGATIYSRSAKLPEQYIPQFKAAVEKVGLNWSDFKVTDNTCKGHPMTGNFFSKAEKFAEDELKAVEYAIDNDLKSFGKGFTVLEQGLFQELSKDEQAAAKEFQREITDAEQFLEGVEKQYASGLPSFLQWGPFKALFGGGSYGAAK
jgi:violaxanthin de-epoxidase